MTIQNSYYDAVSSKLPKVWYRFNETAGTPVNSGSLTNSLTTTGSPLLNENTDVDGRSIYYNGSSSHTLSNTSNFTIFNDKSFSIELWFKTNTTLTNTSGVFTLFEISNNLTGNSLTRFRAHIFGTSAAYPKGNIEFRYDTNGNTDDFVHPYYLNPSSTNFVNDNKWHHLVITSNTTSLKFYLDGGIIQTFNMTGIYPASLNLDSIGIKRIAANKDNTNFFKGWLDEVALYDYELTAPQVNENYVAGTAVYVNDIPGTASALLVAPTWSVQTVAAASAMTASALFVETLPSNFDYVDGIQKIISDLGPETWFKFDYVTDYSTISPAYITNYGSGGAITYTGGQYPDVNQIGPAQEPSVQLEIGSASNYITSTSSALFTTELSDSNFSIGIWFKVPTGIDTSEKQIFAYNGPTNSPLSLKINNKKVVFAIQTSHTTYTHTETNDIAEDVWHLAVMKLDLANTTIKYYLDGTEVFSDTGIQGNRATPTTFSLGKSSGNGTDTGAKRLTLAHYFVDTYSDVTPTIITNLYNAGTRQNQAKGVMRQPVLKFLNKYDDTVQALNPLIQLGLNEVSGTVVENIGSSTGGSFSVVGSNYTRGPSILTKNRYGYNFTNKNTYVAGQYATATNTFSDNTKTVSVYAKINTVTGSDLQIIHFDGGGGGIYGIGLSLLASANGPQLTIIPTTNPATWGTISAGTTYFGDYHLYTMVRDGSNVKLYVDGKQVGNTLTFSSYNLSDSGFTATGGGETVWFGQAAATVNKFVDEVAVFDYALSNQQIFEMWQSIEIDRATSNSEFVMPTNIAGTGYTDTPAPMTASVEMGMGEWNTGISMQQDHFEAFATFILPNYGASVVVDSNYGHTAAAASAVFHDPQFQIGEFNSADHMNASAEMVHPTSISGGQISVSPCIANNATLVMPGIVTIKGARVFAEPAVAQAILPLPPAYVQLSDDKWFATLLEGHSDKAIEPIQALLGNLPNQSNTDIIRGGFLTFFNEFNTDLTTTTTIKSISSEIPAYFFDREDDVQFDENGVLIPLDTSKNSSPARAPRGTNLTTPRMGVGYFDDYERKAVRIENIEFPFPGTASQFSERPYNLEFSIKTIKKDQVLAYGYSTGIYSNRRNMGVVGLSDGKIYLTEDNSQRYNTGLRNLYALSAPHPKNFVNRAQYLLSKTDIADGQWHHIIIQYGFNDNRTQIWIDGKLDRQIGASGSDGRTVSSSTPGLDGRNVVRPYILGFNSNDPLLYSDFETSGWNFYPGRFLTSQQTLFNYLAYLKYEPVKAEPMLGTITIGQENIAQGNRSRMLLLYWWRNPIGYNQNVVTKTNPLTTGVDGNNSPWKPEDLIDDPKKGPIYWEGWDVFPVGIVRPSASDIVKLNNVGDNAYLDIENGRTRLLDLQKDLDLSQFDTIMFANYPTTSAQLDEFIREELVDEYFGVKEKDIYADFLKSLRGAVDQGMSLLVQFDQLARDLKIYDRVERIPVFNEGISDKRAFWHTNNVDWDLANNRPDAYKSTTPGDPEFNVLDEGLSKREIDLESGAYFEDRYNNMRHRVINTVELLTDDPTYIFTDRAFYKNSDLIKFGDPDRSYERFEYKTQGLQPGDEFVFGNPSNVTQFGNTRPRQTSMLAIPFENVKAGRIITAQPEKYWKNNEYVDNPYKNYAHSIALLPGDVLDGKGIGGKIFVSISEVFWDKVNEYRIVDLYTDYWIDISYDLGFFGPVGSSQALAKRAGLKNNDTFVDTNITTEHYNWATYWSRNDNFAFTQVDKQQDFGGTLGLLFESSVDLERVPTSRRALFSAARRRDQLGRFASGSGGNGALFFQLKTGRITETMNIFVPNLFTRAFWWLSERERPTGLIQRPEKATASATMPNATITVDKDNNYNVTAMIANASLQTNISGTVVPGSISVNNVIIPLTANAFMPALGITSIADIFRATALMVDPGIFAYNLEEVILTIDNVEAIVYVRGDKIT